MDTLKTNSPLKDSLKTEAYRLGFQLVGVTTPEPPAHISVYQEWLNSGHHAGMEWMGIERNRERRTDPKLLLPECQSILILGMAYPPPSPEPIPDRIGRIASYAWGDDYHNVLPERLRAIVIFIEAYIGLKFPNRWYTDTGPILEREMAQRAGLGWIGKNTCLISPKAGSYFLLAEILLGIELPPDEAITIDHCGSCTRCIQACPTGCILSNRTIDANRCLSYLTIEEKESLPPDLRPLLGNWIFGCDVCQQVCPWNQRFAGSTREARFAARPERVSPSLKDELAMTSQAFNLKFKGSPIKRAKRRGYLRNTAVALGNTDNPEGIPALIHALSDPEALIRSHSAWALGKIGGDQANQVLQDALITERDTTVRAEIITALTGIQTGQANG